MSQPPKIGLEGAVELLEGLDAPLRDRILGEIRDRQPELFERLKQGLLNIESLLKLDEVDLRTLIADIPREKWARALRACSEDLKARVMENLPSRARSELEEMIVAIGPQPISEVRRLQSEITLVAQAKFGSNFSDSKR